MNQKYSLSTVFCFQKTHLLFLLYCFILVTISGYGQSLSYSIPGTYVFTVPVGVTSITIDAWGAGAGGAADAGGGGGAYAGISSYDVVPGELYTVVVGTGGDADLNPSVGGDSSFGSIVIAKGASGSVGGSDAGSTGAIKYSGGNGGTTSALAGNGGGGSAGSGGSGGDGSGSVLTTGGLGGYAGAAGTGGASGAAGGAGGDSLGTVAATVGGFPGGGGGEVGLVDLFVASGAGANGQVTVAYSCFTPGTITQPSYMCSGSTGNIFSIPTVSGAISYTWSVTGTGWAITSGGSTNTATITIGSDEGTVSVTATTAVLGTSLASTTGPIAVTALNTVSAASVAPIVCVNTAITAITHTTTGATGIGVATGLPTGVTASFDSNTITINGTPTVLGIYTYSIPLTGGCTDTENATGTITVNLLPSAPTIESITQPTCTTTTASIVLTDLPSSGTWTLARSGSSIASTTGTGTSTTISGLEEGSYTFTVTNEIGYTSVASSIVTISSTITTNTWGGNSWDNGMPNNNQILVFAGEYDSSGDLEGCSCQVNAGVAVTINSGHTLTLINELTVADTASMSLLDCAGLVQINNVTNSGFITYKRTSGTVRATDYVYWSSPVASQDLGTIADEIANGTYYEYDPSIANWSSVYTGELMEVGRGYIVRRPDYVSGIPVATESYTASFVGVPNNGALTLSILADRDYLLGNPYPSAINADDFLDANAGILNGTLYFWTHNTEIQLASNITDDTEGSGEYAYTSNDYATYNATGGVAADGTDAKPNGCIAAGQGFFASTAVVPDSSSIVFNNGMRETGSSMTDGSGVNEQFFKISSSSSKTTTSTEKNRIWLNLTNNKGAFKQTLIGYITDASNGFDSRFDGVSYDGNDYIDFYSINENKNLSIQGRALPFDTSDEVPLGYKSTIEGDFTISIDEADGSLADQGVYLEDKSTSTVFDLKMEDYTFSTTIGTFDDRFVLVYKMAQTLSTTDFESTTGGVIVSCKNNAITVNSDAESLDQILVYDLLGREIYQVKDVNSKEYSMTNLGSHQALLVKIILENGTIVTKKIVY
jgi:hypothetical protein